MMRVGIDMHAVHGLMQGSRTYIVQLAMHVAHIAEHMQLLLYLPDHARPEVENSLSHNNVIIKTVESSRVKRLITSFPRQCRRDALDLLHVQYIAPFRLTMPFVVSLHDILHETHPQFYPWKIRKLMSALYPYSARNAAKVFALSEFTRNDVISKYGVDPTRVEIVYPGVSDDFRYMPGDAMVEHVKKKYGVVGEYVLYVGRIEPRKNILSIIKACNILEERGTFPCTLVIAGMMDPMLAWYYHQVRSAAQSSKIHFTGGVEQADLPYLYNGAQAFIYPSYGEGFGLPVIEAMACGVPVIASNVTSLPEAVGDAGIMVDPDDVDALAAALHEVLENLTLRDELREKGFAQAAKFTWKRTAAQVVDLYRHVVSVST